MTEGAPDYVHLRQILARDALGNLVPVACDPSGRVILLPYGTQTVSQDDPTRTIQGSDGLDLYTIAVDAAGRLIMLPYGWDGATYRPLKVDDEGRMIGVMKGQADVKWGLRGWWKFIASEGTTIKDYSGYGNNGSALSGVAAEAKYEDGVIGQCIELDGVDDYIDVGLTSPGGDLTYEAWFYVTTEETTNRYIQGVQDSGNAGSRLLRFTDGAVNRLGFTIIDDDNVIVTAYIDGVSKDEWHHVVGVVDGAEGKIYLDGSLRDTVAIPGALTTELSNYKIGRRPDNATLYFPGYLDEVRIYGRALSADEVSWRYANTNPLVGKPTRMIAVDSEGRMITTIDNLPYKSVVLERMLNSLPPAGSHWLYSSAVPDGKIWILNAINAFNTGALGDTIQLGIYRDTTDHLFGFDFAAGAARQVFVHVPLVLKAGDKAYGYYGNVPANSVLWLLINGYELDV